MGISYEPGVDQQLQPAIEGFAKGLEKLINPNLEFQKAMQKAIGANPELGQRLADLEYNAPGTLKSMGFGTVGEVISQIPETPESRIRRENRGEIVNIGRQELDIKKAAGGLDLGSLNEAIHLFKENKIDLGLKALGLQTQAEQALTRARTRRETVGADIEEAREPAELSKAKIEKEAFDKALKDYPALQQMDLMGLARRYIKGDKQASQDVASGFNTPGVREALTHAIELEKQKKSEEFRTYYIAQHGENSLENLRIREAFTRQTETGTGTLDAWRKYLENPDAAREAIAKPPAQQTQEDKDLIEVSKAADSRAKTLQYQAGAKSRATVLASSNEIARIEKSARSQGVDPDLGVINQHIAAINEAFDNEGRGLVAQYGPRPKIGEREPDKGILGFGGQGTGLYYVDPNTGQRVEDYQIYRLQGSKGKVSLQGKALRAYTEVMASKDRQSALANLKTANKQLYDDVLPYIQP